MDFSWISPLKISHVVAGTTGLFQPSPAKSLMVSAGDIPSRLLQAFNICTVLRPTGRLACFLVSAAAGFRTEKTG